jgi:hypothetical protein
VRRRAIGVLFRERLRFVGRWTLLRVPLPLEPLETLAPAAGLLVALGLART